MLCDSRITTPQRWRGGMVQVRGVMNVHSAREAFACVLRQLGAPAVCRSQPRNGSEHRSVLTPAYKCYPGPDRRFVTADSPMLGPRASQTWPTSRRPAYEHPCAVPFGSRRSRFWPQGTPIRAKGVWILESSESSTSGEDLERRDLMLALGTAASPSRGCAASG